jgi:opacity protein-like surface antigen
MKMKTILLSSAVLFALSSIPVQAADIAAEPVLSDWTGFYVGVQGGYGWGDSDSDWEGTGSQTDLNGNSFSIDVDGGLLGVQLGADYDLGNGLVIGAVGDIAWTGINGKDCADITNCPVQPPWPLAMVPIMLIGSRPCEDDLDLVTRTSSSMPRAVLQ